MSSSASCSSEVISYFNFSRKRSAPSTSWWCIWSLWGIQAWARKFQLLVGSIIVWDSSFLFRRISFDISSAERFTRKWKSLIFTFPELSRSKDSCQWRLGQTNPYHIWTNSKSNPSRENFVDRVVGAALLNSRGIFIFIHPEIQVNCLQSLHQIFTLVTLEMSKSGSLTLSWAIPCYHRMQCSLRANVDDANLPTELRRAAAAGLLRLEHYYTMARSNRKIHIIYKNVSKISKLDVELLN